VLGLPRGPGRTILNASPPMGRRFGHHIATDATACLIDRWDDAPMGGEAMSPLAAVGAFAAIISAVIGATVALIISMLNARVQRNIAIDKLRTDKSAALIDEFFSERIYKARTAMDAALLRTPETQIDNFARTLNEIDKQHLAALLHYFEKLHGAVTSQRVDIPLLQNTLSLKLSWWYLHLIEHFSDSISATWTPVLHKLLDLRALCLDDDYRKNKQSYIKRYSGTASLRAHDV
jgi:hypothetical protein